jgi:hypothetical protein
MNMAQTPPKGKDHPSVKAMEAQRDDRKKANEEAMKRMESSQPTPTQEENDLAKLGVVVEEKQDDKSGPTVITTTVVANEPLGEHGHESERAREARNKANEQMKETRRARE